LLYTDTRMPCCSAKITLWAWLGAWTATRPWLYCLQAAAQAWTSTNLFETCQGTGCLPSSKFEYTCTTTCRYGLCTQNTPGQFMPRRPSSPRHKVKVIHVDPVSSAPRGQSSSPSTTACAAGADQYNERQPRRTAHYQLLQGNCLFAVLLTHSLVLPGPPHVLSSTMTPRLLQG
jgi:hypothetical protein